MYKFEWDEGNRNKSVLKHGIENDEAESIFYDPKYIHYSDEFHSIFSEERFILIGRSKLNRILFCSFTFREEKIRIISTRKANAKNRRIYENQKERNFLRQRNPGK